MKVEIKIPCSRCRIKTDVVVNTAAPLGVVLKQSGWGSRYGNENTGERLYYCPDCDKAEGNFIEKQKRELADFWNNGESLPL